MTASPGKGDFFFITRSTPVPKPLQTRAMSPKPYGASGHKCKHTCSSTALQNSGICQMASQFLISWVDSVRGQHLCLGSE